MKKKLLSLLLSTAMIAALLSGCGSASDTSASASADTGASTDTAAEASTDSAAAPGEEDNVIKIGAICAMTGGSAIYGEGAQNAIDLAVEEINSSGGKYTVEILNGGKVVDDAKDAKQAVNAYNSLLPENPEAIVGSFSHP